MVFVAVLLLECHTHNTDANGEASMMDITRKMRRKKQADKQWPHLGQEDGVDAGVVLERMQDTGALCVASGTVDKGLVHALRVFSQRPDVVAAEQEQWERLQWARSNKGGSNCTHHKHTNTRTHKE